MPVTVRKGHGCPKSKPWAVVDPGGKRFGCHPSKKAAVKQVGAIESAKRRRNKERSVMDKDEEMLEEVVDTEEIEPGETAEDELTLKSAHYVPYNVTSFAELEKTMEAQKAKEALFDLSSAFIRMTENILMSDEIEDKAKAIVTLTDEFAVKVKEKARHPDEDEDMEEKGIAKAIRAVGKWLGVKPKDDPPPEFIHWKDKSGKVHWLARYSNNFLDNDTPPEIVSEKSHRRFVEMVDNKEVPLPRFWVWHTPEWELGEASWVAWDDAGFALAGGVIHPWAEPVLDAIEPHLKSIRVSHGMPNRFIKRDEENPQIIVEHITKELSILPDFAAANQLTGFVILTKETDMAIDEQKARQLVEAWGLDKELLETIQEQNALLSEQAKQAGIKSKEKTVEEEAEEEVETEEVPAETETEPAGVSFDDVVDADGTTLKEILTLFAETMGKRFDVLEQKLDSAREKEVDTSLIPAASLAAMITKGISGGGGDDALIDGRTSLAKSKPKETKHEPGKHSSIPFINDMIEAERT